MNTISVELYISAVYINGFYALSRMDQIKSIRLCFYSLGPESGRMLYVNNDIVPVRDRT